MIYDSDLPGILESITFNIQEELSTQNLDRINRLWVLTVKVNGTAQNSIAFQLAEQPDPHTFIFRFATAEEIPPQANVTVDIHTIDGSDLGPDFGTGLTIDAKMEIEGRMSAEELERRYGRALPPAARPYYGPN